MEMKLNATQEAAVLTITGSTLIIAGAGSGKTRVITSRIAHLLQSGAGTASSIVALTFTNKAAKEMKERISKQTHLMPFVGTFHAYCLTLLKKYGHQIGLDSFTIMDSSDQEKLIHDIVKNYNSSKINPKQMVYHISNAKNAIAIGEQYYLFEYDVAMQEILVKYEAAKKFSKCLDFDDLIIKTVELFHKPEFAAQHHANVKHILVDEYQDTSVIQHKLLKQMSLVADKLNISSVCVVGDEDQSIYSWRGATVDNILQFPKEFPNMQIIKIEQNYRSASSILEIANLLIKNNQNRNPKNLWSDKIAKNRVLIVNTVSGYQEADTVAQTAAIQHANNPLKTIAVLYRTHFQSRVIEEALLKQSIPYKIIGGIQFYERKEIKDLLAYLKLIINKHDRISFSRVYNCPPRKLGAQFEEQFFGLWEHEPFLNYREIANELITQNDLTNTKRASLEELLNILDSVTPESQTSFAIKLLVEKLHYYDYIKDTCLPEEAGSRIDNVRELIRAAEHFEMDGINTVSGFIDEISLMQDKLANQDDSQPHIQLMSLHAAKGLEFDTVIITGIEEGLLPSSRSLTSSESIEEERRLLYVGITRAREHLILTNSRARHTYGQINDQTPSRFINEITPFIDQQIDLAYLDLNQTKIIISCFLNNKKLELPAKNQIKPVDFNKKSGFRSTSFNPHVNHSYNKSIDSFHDRKSELNSKPSDNFKNPTGNTSHWKINQPVKHQVFGVGLIRKIEPRHDNSILTIQFKTGLKKISDQFIQSI